MYHMAFLFPRNKNKWCFGANGWYGNSKYLFRKVCEEYPEVNAIWIAHDSRSLAECQRLGYKAYYWLSFRGLYHSATAGVYISNITIREINIVLAGGAFYFDLWHGIPMKACLWLDKDLNYHGYRITQDNKDSIISNIVAFVELYRKPDLILSPSRFESENVFAKMFGVSVQKCIETNYPQNEMLLYPKDKLITYIKKYENHMIVNLVNKLSRYKKKYIYMPTFRDNNDDIFVKACFDVKQMNKVLMDSNQLLVLKLHPYTNIDLSFVGNCSNIIVIDNSIDPYLILPFIDCLITDYSSVYYDFLQLNREIIIFDYDKEEYLRNNRKFIFDFDEMMPAVRAHSFDTLLKLISEESKCYVEGRDVIMEKVWGAYDNNLDLVEVVKNTISNWRN